MQALIVRTRFLILNFCLEHGINMNLIKTRRIMKKIFFPIVIMATLLVAGCAKENLIEPEAPQQDAPGQTGVTELSAAVELPSKTVLQNDAKVLWTNGDAINVNGAQSAALELDEPVGEVTFTFESVITPPYKAVFPASICKDATTVTLPAYQTYKEGTFSASASPMAAFSENSSLKFNHLCSVLKLTVNLPADSEHKVIKYVDFYGKNGEQVSGDFTLDFENMTLAGSSTAEADKTLRYYVSKTLGEDPFVMYIVVPAQEYANGYTIKLLDEKGHFMEQSKASSETLVAGKIYEKPAFDFVPTGTDLDVEIATAQDLIDFATAYNAREYADEDLLVVSLSQDIVFDETTSAAYAATGGIGTAEEDAEGNTNYFGGVFDGKGFSIKNWNSTCPLFAYTSADGVVENLTIDASCTLTANYAGNNQYYGAFVGYHRGLLTNCHVNANLVASGNWGEAEPHIGALAGRVVIGKIENCNVNGDVTFDNTLVTSGEKSYFGGAVGRVSNADGELKGISVKGNVSLSAGSTYKSSNANDAFVKYGGIVGSLAGTCTDCHLTEADKTFFYGNFVYGSGVAPVNNNYRTQQVGGIAGEIAEGGAVSNCNNYAAVTFSQYNGEANGASGDVSRYLHGGGIAGQIYGELSHCTMYGSLTNRSSCLQQFIGGVVGNVQAKASVHNCANEGASVAAGTSGNGYYQARNNNIGGVIGTTFSTDLSNLTNRADLNCSRMNSKNSATLSMGGVIGKIEATAGEIDGKGNIVNYATISSSHEQYNNQYTAIGGAIGEAKCSVKGVVNEGSALYTIGVDNAIYKHIWVGGVVGYANGALTLTSLENKGTADINISKSVNKQHFNLCVGGILGTNADVMAVALVECENSGSAEIRGGGTKTNGRSVAVGGVVGALTNGASSISGCLNIGCVSNYSSNNTCDKWVIRTAGGCNYIGGIAGYLEGAEDNLLEVTGCENNRIDGITVSGNAYAIYTVRGSSAGLVGCAKYADIKTSQCTTKIYNTNSTIAAGLVGILTNSNLEGCTLEDSIVRPNGGGNACGGIAGYAHSSTVKGNTLNNLQITGTAVAATGVLAGNCDANAVFTDNAVSGSVLGAAITLDSKMIGTGTPTVTGTSLYTADL